MRKLFLNQQRPLTQMILKRVVLFGEDYLKNIFSNFLDFIYPQFCTLCNAPLNKGNSYFCTSCENRLMDHAEMRDPCKICGVNLKKSSCSCSKIINPPFNSIHSIFDFNSDLKKIVHSFKYSGLNRLGSYIAANFRSHIPKKIISECDMAVPVPLHFYRKRKRGFNQARILADSFFPSPSNIEILDILERKKHTKTQTVLNSKKRLKNLTSAISVKKKYIDKLHGKNIVLIDDVITTTATSNACATALINSGAKSVRLLSLARA